MRRNNGITQEEMAEKIHISQSSVSRIETGSRAAKLEHILSMAEALGIQIGWKLPDHQHGIRGYECNNCHRVIYADVEYYWCPVCGYEGELKLLEGG